MGRSVQSFPCVGTSTPSFPISEPGWLPTRSPHHTPPACHSHPLPGAPGVPPESAGTSLTFSTKEGAREKNQRGRLPCSKYVTLHGTLHCICWNYSLDCKTVCRTSANTSTCRFEHLLSNQVVLHQGEVRLLKSDSKGRPDPGRIPKSPRRSLAAP